MENTTENNKLIAEFMGWSYDYSGIKWAVPITDDLIPESDNYKSGSRLLDEELTFHKNWNWLMPVIEKIANLELKYLNAEGFFNPYPTTFGQQNDDGLFVFRLPSHRLHSHQNLIEAAYNAVVEFIMMH